MRKLLVLFVLLLACATQVHAQACSNAAMQDFSTGTAGNVPTGSTLATSFLGAPGSWSWGVSGYAISSASLTYSPSAHMSFIGTPPTLCSGNLAYIDKGNLGLNLDTTLAHPGSTGSYIGFTAPTTGVSNLTIMSGWFRTSITPPNAVNCDCFTMFQDGGTGGFNAANMILQQNGTSLYLLLEAQTVNTNGTRILINPNTWYQISLQMEKNTNGGAATCHLPEQAGDACAILTVMDGQGVLLGQQGTPSNNHQFTRALIGNNQPGNTAPNGFNIQYDKVQICYAGCTQANYPLAETPPYLSNGVLSRQHAIDWSLAGIPGFNGGTLPSANWTQFGSTLAAGSYTGGTITGNMAGCSNQFYLLGTGTFTITSGQIVPPAGCELRMSVGTILSPTGAGAACGDNHTALVCLTSSDTSIEGSSANNCDWTGDYLQGSNQIILSNCTTGTLAAISPSSHTMLFLTQCDTGYSGGLQNTQCSTPSAYVQNTNSNAVDNGNFFVATDKYITAGLNTAGVIAGGSSNGSGPFNRIGVEIHTVTAITVTGSTAVVTITPPIIRPDIVASQNPTAMIVQPIYKVGVKGGRIDLASGTTNTLDCVDTKNASNFWVSDTECSNSKFAAFTIYQSTNGLIQNSYYALTSATLPAGYGIRPTWSSNLLIQNNICQQIASCYFNDGPTSGNVFAYNACFDTSSSQNAGSLNPCYTEHVVNMHNLYEGNLGPEHNNDDVHGTQNFITRFRNHLTGFQSTPSSPTGGSQPIYDFAFSRYQNDIGNVLGTPGVQATYRWNFSGSGPWIYALGKGFGAGGGGPAIPNDPLSNSTQTAWGNYDIITGAVRWCGNSSNTGWVATCGSSSEIPTGASTYPNALPTLGDTVAGQGALPTSFAFYTKPAYFGTTPWPPMGPDVSSGNVGICSGTLNTVGQMAGLPALTSSDCPGTSLTASAWAGHVNAIPAMQCALNNMNMPADGSGPVLPFDTVNICPYGNLSAGVSISPVVLAFGNVAVGTTSGAQTVMVTNTSGATITFTSFSFASGINFVTNQVQSPVCSIPTPLLTGSTCYYSISLDPLTTGALSDTLTISYTGASGSPQTVSMSGTGIPAGVPGVPTIKMAANFSGCTPCTNSYGCLCITTSDRKMYLSTGGSYSLFAMLSATPPAQGPPGPQGIQGIQGKTGATGPAGPPGKMPTTATITLPQQTLTGTVK
jgi:hypothetical protein